MNSAAIVHLIARLAARRAGSSRSDLDRAPRGLDRLIELPMRAEAALLGHGGSLPLGLSILAVFHGRSRPRGQLAQTAGLPSGPSCASAGDHCA